MNASLDFLFFCRFFTCLVNSPILLTEEPKLVSNTTEEFKYYEKQVWHDQVVVHVVSSNMGVVPQRRGDEEAVLEDKATLQPPHMFMSFGLWLKGRDLVEVSFFWRVAGLGRGERMRRLRVEPLLLHIKRRMLRWFWHLIRIQPGHVQLEGEPWGRSRDYKSDLT